MSFRAERIRIAVPLERQRRLFDFSSSRSLATRSGSISRALLRSPMLPFWFVLSPLKRSATRTARSRARARKTTGARDGAGHAGACTKKKGRRRRRRRCWRKSSSYLGESLKHRPAADGAAAPAHVGPHGSPKGRRSRARHDPGVERVARGEADVGIQRGRGVRPRRRQHRSADAPAVGDVGGAAGRQPAAGGATAQLHRCCGGGGCKKKTENEFASP